MYTLEEEKRPGQHFPVEEDETGSFIMNAQDLNMLEHVHELKAAGIDSIKIEGRNKKAFYVATIVNAYRQVLDGANPANFTAELDTVSHRPYSTGFFFGPAHQSVHTDGYEQTCLHVADIVACEALEQAAQSDAQGEAQSADQNTQQAAQSDVQSGEQSNNKWRITVVCHNRFEQGCTLEALVPHVLPVQVQVEQLTWLSVNTAGNTLPVVVDVANRAMQRYSFVCNTPLEVGGFLRLREHRVTSRYTSNT